MDALLSLIGSGAKVNVANGLSGSTALHEAAAFGNKEIVEHLLKNINADANASDFKAVTPLMHASGAGYSVICLLLLQYGATIDSCSAEGMTVLHFTATNGDSYVTQQIVEAGNREEGIVRGMEKIDGQKREQKRFVNKYAFSLRRSFFEPVSLQ